MLRTADRHADVLADGDPTATEFRLTAAELRMICELAMRHAGIVLNESKRNMIYSRLTRRLRQLRLASFSEYCELLARGDTHELREFVNCITTNLTAFFREPHHFEHMQAEAMPRLCARTQDRVLRIWSAGCSTGEEPYSIAMAVLEVLPSGWDVRILASDLDTNVLAHAELGVYDAERVRDLPRGRLQRWFQKGKGTNAGKVRVIDAVRERVTFRQVNLVQPWPVRGPLDVIFCRNVVIYFDKPTQRELFDRFADVLRDGSPLYIGHSETLFRVSERFESLGRTVYRKSA
ncbi:MAG: protein-glutamate O-methyltransferase CheR [Gammaproteobacteria bacterium]